ncbi:MAG: hypothetical protein ABIM89_03285 [Mycobacteriales bacterium]
MRKFALVLSLFLAAVTLAGPAAATPRFVRVEGAGSIYNGGGSHAGSSDASGYFRGSIGRGSYEEHFSYDCTEFLTPAVDPKCYYWLEVTLTTKSGSLALGSGTSLSSTNFSVTVTGGTGRFSGLTGSGTAVTAVDLSTLSLEAAFTS